ncbi:MAG: folC [Gammaproteobacteria bacterium]|jgi:dihydrofolate synthase/folylpolyglutamate synthase|nr:folC [Gammaproteobacteria bacterium]
MNNFSLSDWLDWIGKQHPLAMDLGLDRITTVAAALDLLSFSIPVITVGGTNGKGSSVALLQSILMAAGYRVGAYTSPHLFYFNERICINTKPITDEALIKAFVRVQQASEKTCTLTYFEYTTLAALLYFKEALLDVLILEVGLGGRLDAVNIIDSDVAIVATIALDHIDWLGDTRERIAFEKAGIMREGKPVICGDFDPPHTIRDEAKAKKALLYCQGVDYHYETFNDHWSWKSKTQSYSTLPLPSLLLQNAAAVLMALSCIVQRLPVSEKAIIQGLQTVNLVGRCQYIPGEIAHYLDVSHNPAATEVLARCLKQNPCTGKTWGVAGILADKDRLNMLLSLRDSIDYLCVAAISETPRGASERLLEAAAKEVGFSEIYAFSSLSSAYRYAKSNAKKGDRIIVFGSFYTVSEVAPLIQQECIAV